MLKAFDVTRTVPYSLKGDDGPEPTVFFLGFFDRPLYNHLVDKHLVNLDQLDELTRRKATVMFFEDLVRFGLRSWEGLDGAPWHDDLRESVEIPGAGTYTILTDEALSCLVPGWIQELGIKVNELNFMQGQAGKN